MFSVQFTTLHKVALLIALPVSGVLLYFLLRNNDEDDYIPRERVVTSRHRVIEVKVPKHASGAIIGTQGSQIKQIQETTGARVHFKDDVVEGATERVVVIRGTDEQAQQAELMIRKIVAEIPPILEETIYVPKKCLGRIIGKGGETVRKISRVTKAKVFIDRDEDKSKGDMRDITLKGTALAVVNAKDMIEELLQEEEAYRAKVALSQANRQQRNRNSTSNKQYVQNGLSNDSASSLHDRHAEKMELQNANSTESCGAGNFDYSSKLSVWPEKTESMQEFKDSYISAVEHPGHFWIQLITAESPKLDIMTDNMTKYYSMQAKCQKTLEYHIGDMVAAPFAGENSYYRARVLEVMEDKIDLYYVDYGDSELIDVKEVYPLRNDYLALPFQAFECSIANVEPIDDEWSEPAIVAFENLIHVAKWKVIMAKRVGYKDSEFGRFPSLQLIDTNSDEDIDIAAELVKKGYAKYTIAESPKEQMTNIGSEQKQDYDDAKSSKKKDQTKNVHSTKVSTSKNAENLNDIQKMASTDQKGFLGNLFRLDNFLGLLSNLDHENKDPDYWDDTSEAGSSADTNSSCKKSSNSDISSTGMDISSDSYGNLNSNITSHLKAENSNKEYCLDKKTVHSVKCDFDIQNNNFIDSIENKHDILDKNDPINVIYENHCCKKSNQNSLDDKSINLTCKHVDIEDKLVHKDADTLVETFDNSGNKNNGVVNEGCCNNSHVCLDYDTYPCGYQCEGYSKITNKLNNESSDVVQSLENILKKEPANNLTDASDIINPLQNNNLNKLFLDKANTIQSKEVTSVYGKPFVQTTDHPLVSKDSSKCDKRQDSSVIDIMNQNGTCCKSECQDQMHADSKVIHFNPETTEASFCFQNYLYTKRQEKEKMQLVKENDTNAIKSTENSSNINKQAYNDGSADLSITSNDSDSFQSCNNSVVIECDCITSESSSQIVSTLVDNKNVTENICVTPDSQSTSDVYESPPENVKTEDVIGLGNDIITAPLESVNTSENVTSDVMNNKIMSNDYDSTEHKDISSLVCYSHDTETENDNQNIENDKKCNDNGQKANDASPGQQGYEGKGNVLFLSNEKLPFIFIDKSKLSCIIDEIAEEIVEEISFREVKKEVNSRLATDLSRVIFNEVVEECAGDVIDTVYLSELSKRIAKEISHEVCEEVISEFSDETAAKVLMEEFSKDYVCEFALELSYEVIVEMVKEISQGSPSDVEEETTRFYLDTGRSLMDEMGIGNNVCIPEFKISQSDEITDDGSSEVNVSTEIESLSIDDYDVQNVMYENYDDEVHNVIHEQEIDGTSICQTEEDIVTTESSKTARFGDLFVDYEEGRSTYSEDSLCVVDEASVQELTVTSFGFSDNTDFDSYQMEDSLEGGLDLDDVCDTEIKETSIEKDDNYKLSHCTELFMQQDSGIASSSEINMSDNLITDKKQSQNVVFLEKGFKVNSPRSIKMAVASHDKSKERSSYIAEECPIFSVSSCGLNEELDTVHSVSEELEFLPTSYGASDSTFDQSQSHEQLLIVKHIDNIADNNYEILLSPEEKELEWDGFSGLSYIGLKNKCEQSTTQNLLNLSVSIPEKSENCPNSSLQASDNDRTPVNDYQNIIFDELITPTNDSDLNVVFKNVETDTYLENGSHSQKEDDCCLNDQFVTFDNQFEELESDKITNKDIAYNCQDEKELQSLDGTDTDIKFLSDEQDDADKDSLYSNDSLNQDKDCNEVTSVLEDIYPDSAQNYYDSIMADYEVEKFDKDHSSEEKALSGYSHHQLVKIHSLPDVVKCDPRFDCFIDCSSQTEEESSLNMSVSSIMYDSLEETDITTLKQEDTFKLENSCESERDLYRKKYVDTVENEGNEPFQDNQVPYDDELTMKNCGESSIEASLEDSLEDASLKLDHDEENIKIAKNLVLNVHFSNPDAMRVSPKIVPFSNFENSVDRSTYNQLAETILEDAATITSNDTHKEVLEDSIEESKEVFQDNIKYIDDSDDDDHLLRHNQPLRCSTPLDSKVLDLIDMEEGIVKNANVNNNNNGNSKQYSSDNLCTGASNDLFEVEIENECTKYKAEVCFCISLQNNIEDDKNNSVLAINCEDNARESNDQTSETKVLKSSLKKKKHLKNCPNRRQKQVHFSDCYVKEHLLSPVEDSSSDSDDSSIGASYDVVELKCVQNRYGQDVLKPALLATFDEDETQL